MEFGKAFHMALLQPELFKTQYVVAPSIDRRTKTGKDQWTEFMSSVNEYQLTITIDDYKKCHMMIDAVLSNSSAADLVNNLRNRERLINWIDEETGVPMRGIIDGIGQNYIIDIKTCSDANPYKFQKDAINMDYHRQAAIYLDAVISDIPLDYYLVAIEKDEPYGVSVHRMTDDIIEEGRKQYRKLLYEYKTWADNGMTPAGYEYWDLIGIHEFNKPNWMQL